MIDTTAFAFFLWLVIGGIIGIVLVNAIYVLYVILSNKWDEWRQGR